MTKEVKLALREVRDSRIAKDEEDLRWRKAIVAASRLGISHRQIEKYAGTTNTNIGNIRRRADELDILIEAERATAAKPKRKKAVAK